MPNTSTAPEHLPVIAGEFHIIYEDCIYTLFEIPISAFVPAIETEVAQIKRLKNASNHISRYDHFYTNKTTIDKNWMPKVWFNSRS